MPPRTKAAAKDEPQPQPESERTALDALALSGPETLNPGVVEFDGRTFMVSETGLRKLREPFPAEAIGKLPRGTCKDCRDLAKRWQACDRHSFQRNCEHCGGSHSSATIHLDYVGHADLTQRLLEVDPHWTWEPFTQEQIHALPPALQQAGLWINLTVLGVTRPGFGDADGKSGGSAVKEMIGDALRNAGMRFGIALDLWAKGDRSRFTDETPEPPVESTAHAAGRVDALNATPGHALPETEKRRWQMHMDAWWKDYNALTPEQQQVVRDRWPAEVPAPDSGGMSINELQASRQTFATFPAPTAPPEEQQQLPVGPQ